MPLWMGTLQFTAGYLGSTLTGIIITAVQRPGNKVQAWPRPYEKLTESTQVAMAFEFGCTKRGRNSVIYNNFEFWLHRTNVNGAKVWYCCKRCRFLCKARITPDGERVINERQPHHTHAGNCCTALARKAVGDMKSLMSNIGATPSAFLSYT